MEYGYARASTNSDKQDIGRQKRELVAIGIKEHNIFWEYESGSHQDREKLQQLLETVKNGDTIACTEVSRLSRSTKQLCEILEFVETNKIKLIVGTFIVDCRNDEIDPMTMGMLRMMAVFAQMERDITIQRIKSGMENARAKGKHIGRKNTTENDIPASFFRYYPRYANREINLSEFARLANLSRNSVYKYLEIVGGGENKMRRKLSEKDKKEIGKKCCNCGSKEELEYHHVVPVSLGGKDINSNIVCLCYPCHQKIHYGENKHGLHSTVIKMGLDAARTKGKKLGRPATGVPKEFIKEYNKFQSGEYGSISVVQFTRLQGIAVSTFYKYANILKEGQA